MKLAVKKEEGRIPGGGFHYLLIPKRMESPEEAEIWEFTGHVIIDVPSEVGERLLKESGQRLKHEVEVAHYAERALAGLDRTQS
jgi:hypothetical protein